MILNEELFSKDREKEEIKSELLLSQQAYNESHERFIK
jgi:hypothetical protein